MLETFRIILTEIRRNLFKKMKTSPILYLFFSFMMFFSIVMFAFLTLFLLHTEAVISLLDVFFGIFFLFFIKSSTDLYTNFIKSPYVTYALSTQVSHKKTITEIVLAIFLMNLGMWFLLSGLYLIFLFGLGINISYPVEYLLFSAGVMIANFLGISLALHYSSSLRYRLIPTVVLLAFYWYSQNILVIGLTLPLALLHLAWSLNHAMDSYRFVKRKKRIKEKIQAKVRDIIPAICTREITVLWRDRLLFSFIFMAVITGLFSGYLAIYGADLLIPESLQEFAGEFLPDMFVFLGLYVVVIQTSVFPALNLFLNEEKTMWILRNVPISNKIIVYGKVVSLSLCYITAIPFLAYVSIFIGLDNIGFLAWLLTFSFIAGIIVSVPLGAKYVGKKSDILLLYAVAMILFVIVSAAGGIGMMMNKYVNYSFVLFAAALMIEIVILFVSLKLSSYLISLKS